MIVGAGGPPATGHPRLIEAAMGKSVVREQSAVDVAVIAAEYEEEAPDDDIHDVEEEADPEVA